MYYSHRRSLQRDLKVLVDARLIVATGATATA
jgi:hypothetical protein